MTKPPALSLEDAQARLLALATPLPIERVDVAAALGRYLAEPLTARRTQPALHLSAMDGYAVAPGDQAGPWRVAGESAAGHPFAGTALPGRAVRISTGAALPEGAGGVILQEDVRRDGDTLTLAGEPPRPEDKHVRRRGMDFAVGAQLLPAGSRIGPAQLALALAAGHTHVAVRRPPRVVVVDSGDELSADPAHCAPHQIPASNGAMLAAMVATACPCLVTRNDPVADDLDALIGMLAAAEHADVIVTSGGASVGDHDLVRPALEAWGADLDFWRVAIKPGKPILVATRTIGGRRQLILGLPGNPVSSHVTAFLFLLPLVRHLSGAARPLPQAIAARLAEPMRAGGSRREFLRAAWDGDTIMPHALQDSGALSSLALSNALIDRPAHSPQGAIGNVVAAYLLENGGIA